jgi:hypothetical protein
VNAIGEGSFDDHISGVAQSRRSTLSSELSICRARRWDE